MKKIILITCLLLVAGSYIYAQKKVPYNVVFDITTKDTVVHQMVARWVKGITESYPDAKIEVVFYGKSLDMITTGKSVVAAEVIKLALNKNVSFTVCEAAMKRNEVDKSQLLTGVGTVPDGLYEIVLRQYDGWAYIKASR
jgi:intracellular sulfur oxidation DsrE/DsrF family protein